MVHFKEGCLKNSKNQDTNKIMINLEEFKKSLGSLTSELSEKEILKLRDQQDKEAEIFFYSWLDEINRTNV